MIHQCAKIACCATLICFSASLDAAEIVRLTPETWDAFVPQGKEVDCIYGDYVLRNEHIVAVIAEPLPTRNANMTVRNVGGLIIDLTSRSQPNDQLSCYFANGMPLQFTDPALVKIRIDGQDIANAPNLNGQGKRIEWSTSTTSASGLKVTNRYIVEDGQAGIDIQTTVENPSSQPITQELSDMIRADKSFVFGTDEQARLFWANDEWFRQAYVVRFSDRTPKRTPGQRNQVLSLQDEKGQSKVTLEPSKSATISRRVFPGGSLIEALAAAQASSNSQLVAWQLQVEDPAGAVRHASVTLQRDGKPYGNARTGSTGELSSRLPPGKYRLQVEAQGRPAAEPVEFVIAGEPVRQRVQLAPCGYVKAQITDEQGQGIPCKVSFQGIGGTATPDFGPETGDTAVKNLCYTHDGSFRQEMGPGKYDVVVSFGPEYDAIFTELTVVAGQEASLTGKLRRVVDTRGWVSADFHSHSTPSGDNTTSQLGRVQNLLCENVEFCPCTEHNRVDSYVPLLKKLGVESRFGTCTGMELTGQLLPVNHQNAFPLLHKPRTQDGGGPRTDDNPVVQIERLAMWDDKSDKLVQSNHPNLVQVFADKDLDGKGDGGFSQMLGFMDVMEVHPPEAIFAPPTREKDGKLTRNPIFHWMQLLNLGYRIPGVVNTDAHYSFHDSGWLRNYLPSKTDVPGDVQTMDIVHHAEKGHVVMTTGPYLEVSLAARQESAKRQGIPGDDVIAPAGQVELRVRVQCPNWFDVNRVQVFLNGRPAKHLNFTRRETPEKFRDEVVRFEAVVPFEVESDTHVIVATIGEGLQLGRVMGPDRGKLPPVAVANPIFVDVDGKGFQPNGDQLDIPFPKP